MAQNEIRFGDFLKEISLHQTELSFNDLVPQPEKDRSGHEKPYRPPKLDLRGIDIYRLLKPYVSVRFFEQCKAVIPLAIYLALFQVFILRQTVENSWTITWGLLAVIVGLMLFMEGLKMGLMPFGEVIGNNLPKKSPLWLVTIITFLLGVGVTFAEPAIGALKQAGSIVNVERAPYLYALLNSWSEVLVLVVGTGVGLAAVLGTLRFLYGWSLKPLIYATLFPTLCLTLWILVNPELAKILGLAWDCGAVTTGPVTVPLVLSLGIGVAAAAGKGSSSLSGFGIVTLASLFPVIGVMILAIYVGTTIGPEEIIASAQATGEILPHSDTTPWFEQTPFAEILGGFRAIVPLVLFLFIVLRLILREKIRGLWIILYGISLTVAGMVIFNLGLTYGLAQLGSQAGSLVPAAFTQVGHVSDSPLYFFAVGLIICFIFAWLLGFGATLAEPALNALGITVQNLTNGAFKKSLLMYSVSIGVAFGIAVGVFKIVYDIPIAYLLIPTYLLALILTALSTEEFVNVAWDSAGVTTGPVTVPLVLAMGLGFGDALQAIEGFGILSMASIFPILSVLISGIWVQYKLNKRNQEEPVQKIQTVEMGTPAV